MRRWLPLVVGLALGAGMAPAAAPADPAAVGEAVRQRAERILSDPGYQTAMPEGEVAASPAPDPPPPWLAALVEAVLWLAAAAVVGLLLYLLLTTLGGRRRRPAAPTAEPSPEPSRPVPEPAPAELPNAEALAREGRFGEAVHALLLHALATLARRRGRATLPVGLTSREVLGRSGLEGAPRRALGELVAAVERFLFAGRPLGADDWERSRRAFEVVSGPPGSGAGGAP